MQLTLEEIAEQQKNEENTKKKYITPIIQERWGKENHDNVIMEYCFTDGRVNINGDNVSRGDKKKADYLLLFKDNIPLALVEAKGIDHSAMEGYQQVLEYAEILDIPFAYTTNGIDLIEEDFILYKNNDKLKMKDFPYPEELWDRYIKEKGLSEDEVRLINQPYYIDASKVNPKKPRYYQRIAINRVIDAIAQGKNRMLLVMATGTGKTFTAFQIVWRLWKSKLQNLFYMLKATGTLFVKKEILQDKLGTISFPPKSDNIIGLQLADFIPNVLARKALGMSQKPFSIYDGIENKLYDGKINRKDRFGFKIVS